MKSEAAGFSSVLTSSDSCFSSPFSRLRRSLSGDADREEDECRLRRLSRFAGVSDSLTTGRGDLTGEADREDEGSRVLLDRFTGTGERDFLDLSPIRVGEGIFRLNTRQVLEFVHDVL